MTDIRLVAEATGPAGPITPAPGRRWPGTIREFEELIEVLQHQLVQFAYCRLQSREDAEDVVQDVLLQAYRDRKKHSVVENVGSVLVPYGCQPVYGSITETRPETYSLPRALRIHTPGRTGGGRPAPLGGALA
jgi:hypothetical protein